MAKNRKILFLTLALLLAAGTAIYAFSPESDMTRLGRLFQSASADTSKDVAATYKDYTITMAQVQYYRDTSFTRTNGGEKFSDRQIVDELVKGLVLREEAEKRGLAATEQEIADFVQMTRDAYALPEGQQMLDEYFKAAGITAEEYFDLIEQQAPGMIARQKLTDTIGQDYCKEHGIEFTKVNQPEEVQKAVEDHLDGLFQNSKSQITYYVK